MLLIGYGEHMLVTINYNRERAVEYAERWAFSRNPLFESYDGIGGDCTNFVSQAVYAGSCVMNYAEVFGWYYISPENRAAAWSGVEFFYNFMTSNEGVGPFGKETYPGGLEIGDVIQLGNGEEDYYHTLLVSGFGDGEYLVAAHSNDAFNRPLSEYNFSVSRYIHIEGVRLELPDRYFPDCFEEFISGKRI